MFPNQVLYRLCTFKKLSHKTSNRKNWRQKVAVTNSRSKLGADTEIKPAAALQELSTNHKRIELKEEERRGERTTRMLILEFMSPSTLLATQRWLWFGTTHVSHTIFFLVETLTVDISSVDRVTL